MSLEDELVELARQREDSDGSSPEQLKVDYPAALQKQLRNYLARQADLGRVKKSIDGPQLLTQPEGFRKLVCEEVEFRSDSRLTFWVKLRQERTGWLVQEFEFHLRLASRTIGMIRIELNKDRSYDPLKVPRCHFHVGDSQAHIPFPVMSCRLILHLLCEHIEPDMGVPPST